MLKLSRFFLGLIILSSVFVVFADHSKAASNFNSAAQGLEVSPTVVNLNADKGGSYYITVNVKNVTANTLYVTGAVDDFTVKDESGAPKILTAKEEAAEAPSFSFKAWTTPVGSMNLAAHDNKNVTLTVSVPKNAEAGGHYGIISFSGRAPTASAQQISLSASVGSLVLVRVAGQITEALKPVSFYIAQNNKQTGLVQNGPVTIVSRLENTGNTHVKPSGLIVIKNMLGKTVASLAITNTPGNVLPKSTRKFEQTFANKWLFGRYTLDLNATYGQSGKTLEASTSFWAIPYKLIIVVLMAVILLTVLLRKAIKNYNQRIIRKAQSKK